MTADPAARLRDAGLRVTRQRVAILQALMAMRGHRTADEIADAITASATRIPRASLYHALGVMAQAGVVLVADAGPGTTRYEVATEWHHHLVCRSCGTVVDIPCLQGARPCLDPGIPGIAIDEAQVIFRGTCARCTAGPADAARAESAAGSAGPADAARAKSAAESAPRPRRTRLRPDPRSTGSRRGG